MASSQRLAAKLSNAEYLKKYVGGSGVSSNGNNNNGLTQNKIKKKKKKKAPETVAGVKVVQPKGLKIMDEDEAIAVSKPFEEEEEGKM